jgi:MFS family permease
MSWIFMAFNIGYMLFEIPGGWLGDRWGPRVVLFRIVVWWSVFTALTGSVDAVTSWLVASPSVGAVVGTMILVRFLFGLGEAGAYPNIGRALARWFPFRERAFALGAIWMASRFGGAFAPLLSALLAEWAGSWRRVFWILGGVGVLWAIAFFAWFRGRPEEKSSANAAEIELIRGAASGAGTVYDDHHRGGFSWRSLFLSTNLWAVYVTAAAVSFSWYINITFLPRYLSDRFAVDLKDSKWMTFMPLFVSAFTCLAGGWLSDRLVGRLGRRWGRSVLGVAGFGLAGLCDSLIPWMAGPWAVIALICLACAVQDLALAGLWAVGADIGGRYAGTVLGTMNTMGCIGATLSPLLAAKVSSYDSWDSAFLMFAGAYLLGALLWLRIDATEQIVMPKPAAAGGEEGHA